MSAKPKKVPFAWRTLTPVGPCIPLCQVCLKADGSRLCDHPVGPGKTCDLRMCAGCSHRSKENHDLCPEHR